MLIFADKWFSVSTFACMQTQYFGQIFKQKAKEYGFLACGISKAGFLSEEAKRLDYFLKKNHHGTMRYMENHYDKRLDPTLLMEDCKSVISLAYNYFPSEHPNNLTYKIARYAYGEDYHFVLKDILNEMVSEIQSLIGNFTYKICIDSSPVLEKAWAAKSGVGWIGKNTNLLRKSVGSYFFLCEILTDLELEADTPTTDHCGSCTRCIEACPTDALTPYQMDASRCISYFTIELKDEIPTLFKGQYSDWIFGCDICQEVCPWNRFSTPHKQPRFSLLPFLKETNDERLENLTPEEFSAVFRKSPIKRTKLNGLKRNIEYLKS